MSSPWSSGFLDRMRQMGDPLADHTVQELFRKGQISSVNGILEHLSGNSQSLPPGIPDILKTYLQQSGELPKATDLERVARAQEFFSRQGPALGVALMYSSLPSLYAGSQGGVQILAMTGQLSQHYRRRAAETLRFILDVMAPGGLTPEGKGIRTAQKVRLMHATIRYFARTSGKWAGLPQWGAPINQEELAGTLMSFSVLATDGIQSLGVQVNRAEAEDFLYAWHTIGHVLGVVPELRPLDLNQSRQLWQAVVTRNFAPTVDGKNLAQDHLAFLDEMIPTHALDRINASLMRFLMGKQIATHCLGIKPSGFGEWLVDLLRACMASLQFFNLFGFPFQKVIEGIHLDLMNALQKQWAEGKSLPFRLPEKLGDEV
jgi:ER-bound oxygenase mpaB/B'/Rubber oxygenase, catalytic domain